jgi:hypothetical protein
MATAPNKRTFDPDTAADLANLMAELSHNPKTRGKVAKLVKEVLPDSPHARAFADVEVEDRFEKFQSDQEAKELKRQQDAVLERMNAQRARLLTGGEDGSGRKYGEDDVKKIESLMQQKGISDYEDGAVLYAATLPPLDRQPNDPPPSVHGTNWEFPRWSEFGADPVTASRKEATLAITDLMNKRR